MIAIYIFKFLFFECWMVIFPSVSYAFGMDFLFLFVWFFFLFFLGGGGGVRKFFKLNLITTSYIVGIGKMLL